MSREAQEKMYSDYLDGRRGLKKKNVKTEVTESTKGSKNNQKDTSTSKANPGEMQISDRDWQELQKRWGGLDTPSPYLLV
jgi:hypothetical protein